MKEIILIEDEIKIIDKSERHKFPDAKTITNLDDCFNHHIKHNDLIWKIVGKSIAPSLKYVPGIYLALRRPHTETYFMRVDLR